LKQHEGHGKQKRLEDRSFQQLFWLDRLRIGTFRHASLQALKFTGDVSVPIMGHEIEIEANFIKLP
jgi:hypothetical protein